MTFIAPTAVVGDDVVLGENASVWFHACVRTAGDAVTVGERTNVQDHAVIIGAGRTAIGADVTIGHRARLFGCAVGDHSLIGNASTVLAGTELPPWTFVAVGAVVGSGLVIPEGSLLAGNPARVLRPITPQERGFMSSAADHYVQLVQGYVLSVIPST
jgi:carbonic anhydrase/acetyltransferase-like protein (isoleucine patch superfamily)